MPKPKIPVRVSWTLDQLGELSGLKVLEIGCGAGVAIQALLETQSSSRLRGVDRSPTAIARARGRNRPAVDRGVVDLVTTSFEASDGDLWDCVFAINVNAFWLAPEKSFSSLRRLLKNDGRLVLVWEAPGATRACDIAQRLTQADPRGLALEPVLVEKALVCLKGRLVE